MRRHAPVSSLELPAYFTETGACHGNGNPTLGVRELNDWEPDAGRFAGHVPFLRAGLLGAHPAKDLLTRRRRVLATAARVLYRKLKPIDLPKSRHLTFAFPGPSIN